MVAVVHLQTMLLDLNALVTPAILAQRVNVSICKQFISVTDHRYFDDINSKCTNALKYLRATFNSLQCDSTSFQK